MCVYKHYKVENRVMSGKESKNAFNWCCHVAHEFPVGVPHVHTYVYTGSLISRNCP